MACEWGCENIIDFSLTVHVSICFLMAKAPYYLEGQHVVTQHGFLQF